MKRKQREIFMHDMASLMTDVAVKNAVAVRVTVQLSDGEICDLAFGDVHDIDMQLIDEVKAILDEYQMFAEQASA